MKKGFAKYLPIWIISFGATLIIANILPVEKGDLFNTVYYSIIIAYVFELIIAATALNNKNKDIGQTIFIYSIVGLIMVFVTNWWLVVKQYYHRPWFFAVVNIIVLALHYIFLSAMNVNMNKNAERDEHFIEETETMTNLTKQVKVLYDNTNNEDIYRLYEALRYADKATKNIEIENKISDEINLLKDITDPNEIKDQVNEIIKLINQR